MQPTVETIDGRLAEELARFAGVARVAPQTLLRIPDPGGEHGGSVDVIAFDPAARLHRPAVAGDRSGPRFATRRGHARRPP